MREFENDIENCLKVLREGGIILYPTDTIWGIGCDATNAGAVEKIYQLKNRPGKKSMIILLEDKMELTDYVQNVPINFLKELENLQKPTTFIYDVAKNLAPNLINQDGSIGIRIIENGFCHELIKKFKKPLVSTSANISGSASPKNFLGIAPAIKNGVDYVVEYLQDDTSAAQASSIKKWNADGSITIIRS